MSRRVAITGIGLVTPLGHTIDEFWENIMAGRSGITAITKFDASELPTRIAAEVNDFDPLEFIDKKQIKRMDLSQQYAVVASGKALKDAVNRKK